MKRLTHLLACLALILPAAFAHGASFNCSKASGSVESLVCKDPALTARDEKLEAIYKTASAKAKGTLATRLRQDQRSWIKGRNECWKANDTTWLTASWTVGSVKECVDAQYRMRTSELQAVWRLLPPQTLAYSCQNNPANEVVANFFATDPATLRLERGDRTTTLWQVGAPSAGLYEGQNVSVVHQEQQLTLRLLDTTTGKTDALQCTPK